MVITISLVGFVADQMQPRLGSGPGLPDEFSTRIYISP